MAKTVITGVSGRMGAALVRLAKSSGVELVGGTERKGSPAVGQDLGTLAGAPALHLMASDDLGATLERTGAQVVIDFTSPEATVAHAQLCVARKVAMVVGTTGLTDVQRGELSKAAMTVPVVFAPNMSVGVNVLFKFAGELAKALGEQFDVEVLEAHHRLKKDAPSGTALGLANAVAQATGRTRESYRLSREGQVGERPPGEIGLQTLRGGDVVGEHTVFFFGDGERVELTHRATSRDQFARGALRAATWVVGRPPKLYDMQDVLGLR